MRAPRLQPSAGLALALALVLAPGSVSAHPSGAVVATGGATSSGGGRILHGTVGQPVVGVSGGASNVACHGYWCFGGSRVVSAEGPAPTPRAIAFGPVSPTPSRGTVSFALELPARANVRFSLFDVAGRSVGEPLSLELDAGVHRLHVRSLVGRAGVYFGQLAVDGVIQGRRRIVLAP